MKNIIVAWGISGDGVSAIVATHDDRVSQSCDKMILM